MGYQSLEISKYGFCLSIGPPAARHRCASGCTGSPTTPEQLEVSLEEPLENGWKTVGKRLENGWKMVGKCVFLLDKDIACGNHGPSCRCSEWVVLRQRCSHTLGRQQLGLDSHRQQLSSQDVFGDVCLKVCFYGVEMFGVVSIEWVFFRVEKCWFFSNTYAGFRPNMTQ